MKRAFQRRVVICAMSFAMISGSVSQVLAQDSAPQTSPDLAGRIDSLEKQLADLKSELAAQKAAAAAPAALPAPASAAVAPATPAAAPAPTGLAGLLGPTTLSGFVDVYYGYNSNQPASHTTALRNFDINSAQFGLNMLELVADKPVSTDTGRVGYHVALGFGQAMNLVNATEPSAPLTPGTPGLPVTTETNFDQYLKEGYLEYLAPIGKGLQINAGKFVTPAGAEVIESKDNWNYSRGLLFSWAIPYFHFGVSGKYAFNSKFALTGYLVNGWNNSVDNNSGKTTGFTAAWTPSAKFGLTQNYLVGPEGGDNGNFRHLSDTIVTYTPNSKLSLRANFDYGHDRLPVAGPPPTTTAVWWSGIAGYIKYAPNDKWYFATRGEWFKDHDGFSTGTAQNLGEVTLTLQRMLASKIISRLEYRYDTSDHNVFPYRTNDFRGSQNTVTLGLIYAFSSADAK